MNNRLFLLLLIVFAGVYGYYVSTSTPTPGVYMLDVGQGDSFLVITDEGIKILIDTGEDLSALSQISRVLSKDDNMINAVILTHPDVDHIGGYEYIRQRYSVKCLILTDRTHSKMDEYKIMISTYTKIYKNYKNVNYDYCFGHTDVHLYNFGTGYEYSDTNSGSIITNIILNGTGYLFVGDATSSVLDEVSTYKDIKCDVITAGHHGSKHSLSVKLMQRCHPSVGLISVGKGNPYGHPSKELISLYKHFDVRFFRTDKLGTVGIFPERGKVNLEFFKNKPFLRY